VKKKFLSFYGQVVIRVFTALSAVVNAERNEVLKTMYSSLLKR